MSRRLIATVMATRNRCEATIRCLESLLHQQSQSEACIRVYMTDDGSTDDTVQEVQNHFPAVEVQRGDGSLYWAAAMAEAEKRAVQGDPDYILWLNDDVLLDSTAIANMLALSDGYPGAIIVGAVRDPISGEVTYGGRRRVGPHPQRFTLLPLANRPQVCDTFNGNCVLVPRQARQRVGPIDGAFPHAYADDDYGLRASAAGVPIIQYPGTVGTCAANDVQNLPRGLRARWAVLQSPKGLPVQAQLRYLRRHGGRMWPWWFIAGTGKRVFLGGRF